VARIFRELQGFYGSRFLDMWRIGQLLPDGQDAGIANAKEVWGEKLAGFADQPERIKRALESLGPHPPTLPEFIALCRQHSPHIQDLLPPPTPDADRRLRNIEQAAAVKVAGDVGKAWAHRLIARQQAGERLSEVQVRFASEALT
jgi:hypothetical protein